MSPAKLTILLHHYARASVYDGMESPSFVKSTIEDLIMDGLLSARGDISEYCSRYEVTERGKALVDYICDLPLPEQHWIMPQSVITN